MRLKAAFNCLNWFYRHPVWTILLLLGISAIGLVKLLQAGYTKAIEVDTIQQVHVHHYHQDGEASKDGIDAADSTNAKVTKHETPEERIKQVRDRALRKKEARKKTKGTRNEACYVATPSTAPRAEDAVDSPELKCNAQDNLTLNINNNKAHFTGKAVNYIRFRAMVPGEEDPFYVYGNYEYILRPQLNSVDLTRGQNGQVQHFLSKMCINIQSSSVDEPPENAPMVYKESCVDPLGLFNFDKDGLLRHNVSGKCIGVKNEREKIPNDSPLVITSSCGSHFEMHGDGLLRHVETKMCVHPLGGGSQPSVGQELCLFNACGQENRLKYRWFTVPESVPTVDLTYTLDQDFAEIETQLSDDRTRYDFHLAVSNKKNLIEPLKETNDRPVNVIVIMFDEVSRAHFHRKMKLTVEVLSNTMKVYDYTKHTLRSAGFRDNMEAILFGKEGQRSLFHHFKKKGYATLFSVDKPSAGSEELTKQLKADHDATLFWKAVSRKYNVGLTLYCLGLQLIYMPSCNYLRSFLHQYGDSPKFAFVAFSEITRWNRNGLKYMDEYFAEYLKTTIAPLKNTVVVFTSSKGSSAGAIGKSSEGKLEAKLPLLDIWVSEDRREKLTPGVITKNTALLSTPFDVYETLANLVDSRGDLDQAYNLLGNVRERDCDTANVPRHLCPCE